MDLIDRLLDHDRWATTMLLEVSPRLTGDQLDREFNIGHRTLRETFRHLIENVERWTAGMAQRRPDAPPDDWSVPALIAWHERAYDDFAMFARQLRDQDRLDDTFGDAFDAPMTYGGAILHVILHDEGHRTEAVHILTRLDVPDLPEVDHGLWDFVRRGPYQPGEAQANL